MLVGLHLPYFTYYLSLDLRSCATFTLGTFFFEGVKLILIIFLLPLFWSFIKKSYGLRNFSYSVQLKGQTKQSTRIFTSKICVF